MQDESEFVVEDVAALLEFALVAAVVLEFVLVFAVVAVQVVVVSPQPLQRLLLRLATLLEQFGQCPAQQQPRLLEPARHLRRPQNHTDVGPIPELVGGGQTGPSSHSDARLESDEALPPEQFVGVLPLDGATAAAGPGSGLVDSAGDHSAEELAPHADAAEFGDVGGSGLGLLVGQAVGVGELGVPQLQLLRVLVHFGHEGLLLQLVVVAGGEEGAGPVGELVGGVVAAGEHESVEHGLQSVLLPLDQVGGGAGGEDDFGRDHDELLPDVDLPLLDDAQDSVEGHDLGEAGDLEGDGGPVGDDDAFGGVLDEDVALRLDLLQLFRILVQNWVLLLLLLLALLQEPHLVHLRQPVLRHPPPHLRGLLPEVVVYAVPGLHQVAVARGSPLGDGGDLVGQGGQILADDEHFPVGTVGLPVAGELLLLGGGAGEGEFFVGNVPGHEVAGGFGAGGGVGGGLGVLEGGDEDELLLLLVGLLVLLDGVGVVAGQPREHLQEVEVGHSSARVVVLEPLVRDLLHPRVRPQLQILYMLHPIKLFTPPHLLYFLLPPTPPTADSSPNPPAPSPHLILSPARPQGKGESAVPGC